MPNIIELGAFFCGPFCFDFLARPSKNAYKMPFFVNLFSLMKPNDRLKYQIWDWTRVGVFCQVRCYGNV